MLKCIVENTSYMPTSSFCIEDPADRKIQRFEIPVGKWVKTTIEK
jgi:hypothetical protein